MPIKRGRIARRHDIAMAIQEHDPFAADPNLELDIVLPTAKPDHLDYRTGITKFKERDHRAHIRDARTGTILITAQSTYELLAKIKEGWKYDPNKREGLLA